MSKDHQGQVALVTGASRGIGRAVSVALAREGFTLALWGRSKKELAVTQSLCEREGALAYVFVCELANERKVEKAFKQTVKSAGHVELLVNNAGIGFRKLLEKTRPRDWDEMMAVNMRAPYLLMRLALPRMKKARSGQIINIGSEYSLFGSPFVPDYSASKGGVIQLTKSLAVAWANVNIQVNAIIPGWITSEMTQPVKENTEMFQAIVGRTPAGRFGEPEELGGAGIFLASAASDFVTGQSIVVDGGYSVS